MGLTPLLFAPTLAWLIAAAPAAAGGDPVLFDNGVPDEDAEQAFSSQLAPGSGIVSQVADDFSLDAASAQWEITGFDWLGTCFAPLTADCDQFTFHFIVYADDGGVPTGGGGPVDPTPTALAVRTVAVLGQISPTVAILGDAAYDYAADVAPIVLDAETRYWLAIQALDDNAGLQWFWAFDRLPGGDSVKGDTGVFGNDFWSPHTDPREFIFAIRGRPVPEPSPVASALLGASILGLLGSARRRHCPTRLP